MQKSNGSKKIIGADHPANEMKIQHSGVQRPLKKRGKYRKTKRVGKTLTFVKMKKVLLKSLLVLGISV